MTTRRGSAEARARLRRWARPTARTALAVVGGGALSFGLLGVAVGSRPLVAAKYGLFVLGWALLGYASLVRRVRAGRTVRDDRPRVDGRLGDLGAAIPGLRPGRSGGPSTADPADGPVAATPSPSRNARLLVASLLALVVSFLLEWPLGVGG